MSDYGQDILDDGLERLDGTWEYAGREFDLKVEDISYPDYKLVQQYAALSQQVNTLEQKEDIDARDIENLNEQAENLDQFSWEGDEDEDFVPSVINAKLIQPNVEIENTSVAKLRALLEGMMQAWQESTDVENARGQMPIEGNP